MAKKYSLALSVGETLSLELRDLIDEAGAPITSATGWSGRLQVRSGRGAPAVLDITSTVSGAGLRFQSATTGIAPGSYFFDVRLSSPTGFTSYPVEGDLLFSAPITVVP